VIGGESRVLESVAGVSYYDRPSSFAVVENGSASRILAAAVAGDFARVLGVEPFLGRALDRSDDVTGAENVLVITHALWQRRYGGCGARPQLLVRQARVLFLGRMPAQRSLWERFRAPSAAWAPG
jgi:hypothetical protein